MSRKHVILLPSGLDCCDYVLGVTEEFDDLAQAETEAVNQIRQPTTRRTAAMVPGIPDES